MAVYKVPQDVEAEDKLVGPFTLKQFIFLVIAVITAWLAWQLYGVNPALALIPLPLTLASLILGLYRKPDQPVEVYLASLLRFYLKPRKRLWDRDGHMEAVKITAPPKIEKSYSDGRSREQVDSQLQNLASMMDTRGWSTKNANLQEPNDTNDDSDRLVTAGELPNTMQPSEIHASDDMMDPTNNMDAQNLSERASSYNDSYLQNAISKMQIPKPTVNNNSSLDNSMPQIINDDDDSTATNNDEPEEQPEPQPPHEFDSNITRLSQNRDLNVSTLARHANKHQLNTLEDEQEISLN